LQDNSVAIASFVAPGSQLLIESEIIIQQYNETPLDLLVADYAINFPFEYLEEDKVLLLPYMILTQPEHAPLLVDLMAKIWRPFIGPAGATLNIGAWVSASP
jgi:hypothetical protein